MLFQYHYIKRWLLLARVQLPTGWHAVHHTSPTNEFDLMKAKKAEMEDGLNYQMFATDVLNLIIHQAKKKKERKRHLLLWWG